MRPDPQRTATMPAGPQSHPLRKFLRFSLRGLIVFVLVIGVGLGWIARQAHIQRDAVGAIRKAGGHVAYSWEWDHGLIPGGSAWAPSWVVQSIGVDFFGHVTRVDLVRVSGPADSVLAEVGRLNQLQCLWLNTASVTNAGLVHLKGLTNLSVLGLIGYQGADAALAHLKALTELTSLDLYQTNVTDAGLVHLKVLTNLKTLDLSGTRVTDAGLMHLKGLTNLSVLGLHGTQVTDTGVYELKRSLPRLTIYR